LTPEGSDDPQWVTIALVATSRGNRGEVSAIPLSDRLERFQRLREVFLFDAEAEGEPLRAEVESVWEHRGRIILKFRGVDSISAAETLRGKEVRIPRAEREPLPEGEYYESDLIGFEVLDRQSGRLLGRVAGWQHYGGPALLEVEGPGGKVFEIPFAASICVEIDMNRGRIQVDLPEGLEDLNG